MQTKQIKFSQYDITEARKKERSNLLVSLKNKLRRRLRNGMIIEISIPKDVGTIEDVVLWRDVLKILKR